MHHGHTAHCIGTPALTQQSTTRDTHSSTDGAYDPSLQVHLHPIPSS